MNENVEVVANVEEGSEVLSNAINEVAETSKTGLCKSGSFKKGIAMGVLAGIAGGLFVKKVAIPVGKKVVSHFKKSEKTEGQSDKTINAEVVD